MIQIFISDNQDVINAQMNITKKTDVTNFVNFSDITHSKCYDPMYFVYDDEDIYKNIFNLFYFVFFLF